MDYFIIGILGSGTKALASLLIQMGNKVCGVDKKEAINRLRYEQPNLQICFRTEKALAYLTFERSIKV